MTILDANAILRYILDDIPKQAGQVEEIIRDADIEVLPEIIAEVIYILSKFYNISRNDTANYVCLFLDDVNCANVALINAVRLFGKINIDFVDCLLYEYSKQPNRKIFTFDKKLLKLLQQEE